MAQVVTAVYDANILYPAPMRDLFIRLAHAGLVRGRWSDAIHDEWTRSVLQDNPHVSAERLARTRSLMNEAVRDCLVTGFEELIPSLVLPDPKDRHVLAAAIRAGATIIVTCNLKDFPVQSLSRFGIESQHPDAFLLGLLDAAPEAVSAVVQQQQESLHNPPKSAAELLEILERQGLPRAVARLRQLLERI